MIRVVVGVAALVLGVIWISAAAPTRAEAYVGENIVEVGANGLTAEAEKVVSAPAELPELFEGNGGFPPTSESNAFTDFFESAGKFPILAPLVALGAGIGVGSLICHSVLGLEGCWFYGTDGAADPATTGVWKFNSGGVSGVALWQWYWTLSGGGAFSGFVTGVEGTSSKCGVALPAGTDYFQVGAVGSDCEGNVARRVTPQRWTSTNRKLEVTTKAKAEAEGQSPYSGSGYCPAVGPGSLSCGSAPPANWIERLRTCLDSPSACGLTIEQRDHIGEHIASQTASGEAVGVRDPLARYVKVPSCSGLTWAACQTKVKELELVPERFVLTWQNAVIADPPSWVEEVKPPAGNEVKVGTKLTVTTNPDTAAMPAVVPSPEKGETYAHYAARLNPALEGVRVNVDPANQDAAEGPDVALRTQPLPGTREDPGVKTQVTVYTNPPDAGVGAAPGGCNTSIGSVDFSALNHPLGSKFPFGIFGFFVGWIGEWTATTVAPSWTLTLVPSGVFGSKGIHLPVSLAKMEGVAEVVRIAFLFASFVGLLWFLGTAAARIQGDDS